MRKYLRTGSTGKAGNKKNEEVWTVSKAAGALTFTVVPAPSKETQLYT